MTRQSLLALRKTAHSDPFPRLSAQIGVRTAHSDPFSRLSAQIGVRNAHSDPFSRLSAQVGASTAHSNQKSCLSRRIIKKTDSGVTPPSPVASFVISFWSKYLLLGKQSQTRELLKACRQCHQHLLQL